MMNGYHVSGPSAMDKRPVLNYYIRLESESSINSEEDAESVNSIQGRETELAQDSTDTDSYFEYEVASLSEENDEPAESNSSSGIDDLYVTEEVIAAVLGDTSLEAWAPDGEDSYSSTDTEEFSKTDFRTCSQCKSKNNNPRFRLCEKCFQERKNFYPPRPRRSKKRKNAIENEAVNVDNLRSCLSGLSQDSGVGCSQEFLSLDFKEIKVPEQHLNKSTTSNSDSAENNCESSSTTKDDGAEFSGTKGKKRKLSDSLSDNNEVRPKKIIIEGPLNSNDENLSIVKNQTDVTKELNETCIMCAIKKKDGIFLHGNSAHSCCCYECAKKTWKTTKRCPVCKRRVNNVVRLYTI